MSDFEKAGDDDVVEKIMSDVANSSLSLSEQDIRTEMERLFSVASEQIMAEA